MDYLQEIRNFYDWLIVNPMHSDAQSFWHLLMNIRDKCGEDEFTVSNQLIQLTLGISQSQLDRVRLQLIQKGRIEYKKRNGRQSGLYKIIPFVTHNGKQTKKQPEKQTKKQNIVTHNGEQPGKQPGKQTGNKEAESKSPTKTILTYYQQAFQRKFNEIPVVNWAKDGAIVKRLVGTYGEDKLKGLIDAFFESSDQFIKRSGYTIGVFSTVINKLLINNKYLKNKAVEKDDDWYFNTGGGESKTG